MPFYSTFEQHTIDDIMLNIQNKLRNKKITPKPSTADNIAAQVKRRIGNKQQQNRSERNVLLRANKMKLSGSLEVPKQGGKVSRQGSL